MTGLVMVIAGVLGSAGHAEEFDRANLLFQQADYARAAEGYERLIAEGVAHPAVFYNLGNAYYRLGRLGPAIANYERALCLEPGFDPARQNLAQCLSETEQKLARPGPASWKKNFFFWHYELPPRTIYRCAFISWLSLWGVLALRTWRPLPRLRIAAGVLAAVSIAFGVSAWHKAHPPRLAVVIAPETPARYGAGERETVRFNLYEGDRVIMDQQRGEWVRVIVADGDRGWTRAQDLLPVGPPYVRAAGEGKDPAAGAGES